MKWVKLAKSIIYKEYKTLLQMPSILIIHISKIIISLSHSTIHNFFNVLLEVQSEVCIKIESAGTSNIKSQVINFN